MAISFGFYTDAALTTPLSASLLFVQDVDAPAAQDKVIYFGSPAVGKIIKAASNPGVDPIVVSVADAASGSGSPATDVKLALSAGGLSSAVGGAPLSLDVSVLSGTGGAKAIHVRVLDSTGVMANNTDLSLTTGTLAEFAV